MTQQAARPINLTPLDDQQDILDELVAELAVLVSEAGFKISRDNLTCMVRHLLYVEQVNSFINLTRITDLNDALVLHIVDSLLFSSLVHDSQGPFLDMGTGAGFPGIPFSISTGLSGVLLDSVGKKVNAVATIASELNLNQLQFVHARVEDFAADHPGEFSYVMARAMASLPILIEYATPLLRRNGSLLISKGQLDSQEFESGICAARICGLRLDQQRSIELPHQLGHRELLSFVKIGMPSVKLPRSAGAAKRNPLA